MGRTNGKLIPFLQEALEKKLYNNLEYEDDAEGIFYLRLPRAGSEMDADITCERILQDWYGVTGNKNYVNYSSGKTVFQAALKKSIYLITLPRNGTKKRFKFSTPDETKEKKEYQKKRSTVSETSPPSVSSSGYQSGSDNCIFERLLELSDTPSEQEATSETGHLSEDSDVFESSMELDTAVNQDSSTTLNFDDIDLILDKNAVNWNDATLDHLNDLIEIMKNDEPSGEAIPNNSGQSMSVDHTLLGVSNMAPVREETELLEKCTVPFQQNANLNQHRIWVCKKKTDIESVAVLICESMIIENNDASMQEQIIIPHGMLEGREYILEKSFILLDKLFMFFI